MILRQHQQAGRLTNAVAMHNLLLIIIGCDKATQPRDDRAQGKILIGSVRAQHLQQHVYEPRTRQSPGTFTRCNKNPAFPGKYASGNIHNSVVASLVASRLVVHLCENKECGTASYAVLWAGLLLVGPPTKLHDHTPVCRPRITNKSH